MTKLLGTVLIAAAIAFLGFTIYRATDRLLPQLDAVNAQIAGMRLDVQQLKAQVPELAKSAGQAATAGAIDQTKREAKTGAVRAASPDPRQHLDPLGILSK